MAEKEIRYEAPAKPVLEDVKEILPDTQEFCEPEKTMAIIKHLSLSVGDTLRDHGGGEYYIINPRHVLRGTSPDGYKKLIAHFKSICTPLDIAKITAHIKSKRKDREDKLYYPLEKKLQKKAQKMPKHESVVYLQNEIHGISNTLCHLLSKGPEDFLICYRAAWLGKPIPDQREWREEDDGEYRVLTDSEADRACEDYLEDSRDSWVESVKAGMTDESFEDWKESAVRYDGRGQTLNHYNGSEDEEEVNGVTYYIYRTN